jgi:hypothetical protein
VPRRVGEGDDALDARPGDRLRIAAGAAPAGRRYGATLVRRRIVAFPDRTVVRGTDRRRFDDLVSAV